MHARRSLELRSLQSRLNNDYFMTHILHRRANLPTVPEPRREDLFREPVIENVKKLGIISRFQPRAILGVSRSLYREVDLFFIAI